MIPDLAKHKLGPKNFVSNFFFKFFFIFFLSTTKSVHNNTKSHPNSKLFKAKCIAGDAVLFLFTYKSSKNLSDFKIPKSKCILGHSK